jgi:multiple sugar transport system permease protein
VTSSAATIAEGHRRRLRLWPYGVVVPLLAVFFTFNTLPVLRLFELSLLNWPDVVAGRGASFGLDNFRRLASDPVFLKVLGNTLLFTLIRVPLGLGLGLLAALAIQRTRTFRAFYTTAWFSPFMTSVVAMALVFTYLYNPTFGFFNYLLGLFGLPPQGFLRDPDQALLSIVLVDLWKSVGFNVVIFMAGLSGIPSDYYEAAAIDGASRSQTFRNVTLPLLSRTTYLLLLIGIITSMRVFVPVYMMTGFSLSAGGLGGPLNSTNVLTLYMYQSAFRFNDFGYAAAVAAVLFVLVLLVTLAQFRLLRTDWEY